jgi:hypothetical protein
MTPRIGPAGEVRGTRVRFVYSSDPYTRLASGTLGTVVFVDDLGTVHVKWDDGSGLGLVPSEDIWAVVEPPTNLSEKSG